MDGRQRAAHAVAARRGKLGMTQQQLADAAGVDIKTIGNLESRGRWPIARTRARIEAALGWPSGELARVASEEEPRQAPVPPELAGHQTLVDQIREQFPDLEAQARVMREIAAKLRGDPQPTPPSEDRYGERERRAG